MESPLCPPSDPGFRLIETLRWAPDAGFVRGERHFARLHHSAKRLGITPRDVDAALSQVHGAGPLRVRVTLDRHGQCAVTTAPYTPLGAGQVWRVAIAEERLNADDPWLRVKNTERALYDQVRAALPDGVDEMLFLNQQGALCEGTITNVFVDLGQGLSTPPLSDGVLPGILRAEMLERGDAHETRLTLDDLTCAKRIFVGNSLRGMIPAQLV